MNELDRQELERLWARHKGLEQELRALSTDIRVLSLRLHSQELAARAPEPIRPAEGITPGSRTTPATSPVHIQPLAPQTVAPPPIPSYTQEMRPAVEPAIGRAAEAAPEFEPGPAVVSQTPSSRQESGVAQAVPPGPEPALAGSSPGTGVSSDWMARNAAAEAAATSDGGDKSIEMRLGTYWLVRIGIVMLLTGLVFFGNYAYQSFISKLGAPGKVGLMYFASALLLGAGAWWQRKKVAKTMRNYAEVLFAGGLAGVYFTTYAAHHISHLQIIQSPILDGFLLVAWASLIVWIADRRKSEVLAMFAIGLAYYASIVTRAGQFTLWSNLVLSAGAVVFLVRNRWAGLSIGSLIATYAGYAFWRFFEASAWHFPEPGDALTLSAGFLCAYWLVFTAAVFLARDSKLSGLNRAGFLTANNAAFFSLFILTMFEVRTGGFWKISLGFGTVLLILAEVARRVFPAEPSTKNFYLTQGLLLVTIGFIAKFEGFSLALVLGAQSVVLLSLGDYRKNKILQAGAWLSGGLSMGWCLDQIQERGKQSIFFPVGLGAMFIANTFLSHLRNPAKPVQWFRASPAWFTSLALIVWLAAIWKHVPLEQVPLVVAGAGLILTLSVHLARVREVTLISQIYLLMAPIVWAALAMRPYRPEPFLPWWNPAIMLALVLATMHWWQKQRAVELTSRDRMAAEGMYAATIVLVVLVWMIRAVSGVNFMAWAAGVALLLTLYAVGTRAWMLGAAAQVIALASVVVFAGRLSEHQMPHWGVALAPIILPVLLAAGVRDWFKRQPEAGASVREPLLKLALIYRSVAVVMSVAWVLTYVPQRELIWVFTLMGMACFAWAGWRKEVPALWFSGAYFIVGFFLLLANPWKQTVYVPNILLILGIAVVEQLAARRPETFALSQNVRRVAAVAASLALWVFVSRCVLRSASGFYLTASWSVVALVTFGAGVVLRERAYRWFGLAVLFFTLGRVLIFDVWKLQTLYRVLSFLALGTVLIVLNFIYIKYQERIKQWL